MNEMKRIGIMLFCLLILLSASSCKKYETNVGEKNEDEVYVPKNIQECFDELNKIIKNEDRKKIISGEIEPIEMHFGIGMWLRNSWGLWKGSRLAAYFNEMGIYHPDDMSGIILDSYPRYLRCEPLELEKQIVHYQEYWREVKGQKAGGTQGR